MEPEDRTIAYVYKEMVSHPFMPLLFISEAIKEGAVYFIDIDPLFVYTGLAIVAMILWGISDMVEVDVDNDARFWK